MKAVKSKIPWKLLLVLFAVCGLPHSEYSQGATIEEQKSNAETLAAPGLRDIIGQAAEWKSVMAQPAATPTNPTGSNYARVSQEFEGGHRPVVTSNAIRAGRCYSPADRKVGVQLVLYRKDNLSYAFLMGIRTQDGSFSEGDSDLDNPAGFYQRLEELRGAVAELIFSPERKFYQITEGQTEFTTRSRAGSMYRYRQTPEKLVLKLEGAGRIEFCEFGKVLISK